MTKHSTLLATSCLLFSLMACKLFDGGASDEKPDPEPSAAAEPKAAPSAAARPSASAAPKPPEGLFAAQLPEGLVPVDRSAVPVEALKKAAKLEDDATKARKAKKYDEAVTLYVQALAADPGYPAARYNLARTLILAGKIDAGIGVLDQLYRTQNCYRCEGLLLRAAQEKDFKAAYDRPEFKERTTNVGKRLPTFMHAARQVIQWLHAPTLNDMPPLVDLRTHLVLQIPGEYKQFRGAQAFIDYVVVNGSTNFPKGRKWGPTVGPPMGMSVDCKNECCDISTYDPPGERSVLRQICFKAQGNAATALYKIKVD